MSDQQTDLENRDAIRSRIGRWSTLALIVSFFFLWIWLATNVPYQDELGRVFRFLMELDKKESFAEQAEYTLTHQTNEHRIVVFRIIFLSLLKTVGYINVKHLMFVGSVSLVLTFILFYKSAKQATSELNLYYMLPVTLLLFVPLHEISDWGLNLTAYLVYFFAFGSLWFLHKSNDHAGWFPVAILFAVLAAFTFGSGLFVFVAGILLTIFPRVSLWKLVVWISVAAMTFAVYFHHLEIPGHRPGVIENLQSNFFSSIGFFFAFCGAAFKDLFSSPIPQTIIGVLLVGLLVATVLKNFQKFRQSPLLLVMLIYLCIFFVPTSINRGYMGLNVANAARYQIIPAIFLSVSYLVLFSVYSDWIKRNFGFILGFSVILFASRMSHNLPLMDRNSNELHAALLKYHLRTADADSNSDDVDSKWLNPNIMDYAIEHGHYRSPAESIWTLPETSKIELPGNETKMVYGLKKFVDTGQWTHVIGYAMFEKTRSLNPEKFLLLTSEETGESFAVKATIIYDISWSKETDTKGNKKYTGAQGKYYNPGTAGFLLVINKKQLDIPRGEYKAGILMREGSMVGFEYFDEVSLLIEEQEQPAGTATKTRKKAA